MSFLCSEFSNRFLKHSEHHLKSLPWFYPWVPYLSHILTLLSFDYSTPSKIASMLFLKPPPPGISTWLSNCIQVSAQTSPLQEGPPSTNSSKDGSLTSVIFHLLTPGTHPSYTHPQPPPPSVFDSLPKILLWPRAVFILSQRGQKSPRSGA